MANVIRYEGIGPAAPMDCADIPVGQAFMGRMEHIIGPLELLLRTFMGVVSLQNADRTWSSLIKEHKVAYNYRPVDLEIIVRDAK